MNIMNPITKIRHSLSTRIGLLVMIFAVLIFVVSIGFLYVKTRNYVREDALRRASQVLNNTVLRVSVILNEVEIATNNTDWLVRTHLHPDSVVVYSRRLIEMNPNFKGCSISFEPYFFKEKGEYFSVYSFRENDTIRTEQEGSDEYRYYDMEWYLIPKQENKPCWVDPFYDDYIEDNFQRDMITSYVVPLISKEGQCMGVISADLSLSWLSRTITSQMPSAHSYCIMLGREGTYYIHPDTKKLVVQTIFTDTDPDRDADLIELGNSMLRGEEGMKQLRLNDENCFVFYRQLPQTGWSMAIIYPENEIFHGYNRLFYIVLAIIFVGLLLLFILCRKIINNAIMPVNQLANLARRIAAGNFDEHIPRSDRIDPVGQLQNTFSVMQESISGYVNDIYHVKAEIEEHNNELVRVNKQVQEALEKKTAFMQDLTHQVRTPLNIIIGFSQVLRMGHQSIPEEELVTILNGMQVNSQNIKGIIDKLLTASFLESTTSVPKDTWFACNDLCRKTLAKIKLKCPDTVKLKFVTCVPDSLTIPAISDALPKMLQQMLDNANQFTQEGLITLECRLKDERNIHFIVTDTGIGIAKKNARRIFIPFLKLDYYSEGLGIGLTLIRRGAELMGGTFILDSSYKGGARFILTLPL